MTIFAYLRVSTDKGQTTENQKKQIRDKGYAVADGNFYADDGVSGTIKALERPAFKQMMAVLQQGDSVIVTMLDRLGRNAIDILSTVEAFKAMGVSLEVMQLGADLTGPAGKMITHIFACMAEMERDNIVTRTKSGLARTKAQGTKLGQPLKIHPTLLRKLCQEKEDGATLDDLAKKYKVPRNSIARNISKWKDSMEAYEEEFEARKKQYKGNKAA